MDRAEQIKVEDAVIRLTLARGDVSVLPLYERGDLADALENWLEEQDEQDDQS